MVSCSAKIDGIQSRMVITEGLPSGPVSVWIQEHS